MTQATLYSERILHRYAKELMPYADRAGVPRDFLLRHDVEIPVEAYARLLDEGAHHVDPLIGFEIGKHMVPADLGAMGHAAAAAATVQDMLQLVSRYLLVFSHVNGLRLAVGSTESMASYRYPIANVSMRRHDVELALATIVNYTRQFTGRHIVPIRVEFSHRRPCPDQRFETFFGCDIEWERPGNRVYFETEVMKLRQITHDPSLLEALLFYMDTQMKVRGEDRALIDKVRHVISTTLSEGEVHIQDVARQLGMSQRSLQRHLKAMNAVFSDLVEECRKHLAEDYVRSTAYPLTEIALMLGYGELSSFSRAYKRWTGESPQQARQSG